MKRSNVNKQLTGMGVLLFCMISIHCGDPAIEPQCGHEETGTIERVGFITQEEVFFLVQTGEVADK